MVQVPRAMRVKVFPETVQTDSVEELKLTASFDELVALTGNGAEPKDWFESAANAMVWLAGVTVKLWFTGVAAV
jgi:hypothetical protein